MNSKDISDKLYGTIALGTFKTSWWTGNGIEKSRKWHGVPPLASPDFFEQLEQLIKGATNGK